MTCCGHVAALRAEAERSIGVPCYALCHAYDLCRTLLRALLLATANVQALKTSPTLSV